MMTRTLNTAAADASATPAQPTLSRAANRNKNSLWLLFLNGGRLSPESYFRISGLPVSDLFRWTARLPLENWHVLRG
jgi:hypothetical protein